MRAALKGERRKYSNRTGAAITRYGWAKNDAATARLFAKVFSLEAEYTDHGTGHWHWLRQ